MKTTLFAACILLFCAPKSFAYTEISEEEAFTDTHRSGLSERQITARRKILERKHGEPLPVIAPEAVSPKVEESELASGEQLAEDESDFSDPSVDDQDFSHEEPLRAISADQGGNGEDEDF